MPKPKSVLDSWKEMRETWHHQNNDPGYEYDTPVPTPTKFAGEQANSDMVNSIGDLSPKGSKLK